MNNQNSDKTSAFAIILANLVPLAGVLFLGWSVFSVVFLFWLESLIIGFFNVWKMIFAQKSELMSIDGKAQASGCAKLFLIPFFMVHYGMFMVGQGIFIFVFLGNTFQTESGITSNTQSQLNNAFWLALLVLFINHLGGFLRNYIFKKAYQTAVVSKLLFAPYGRVFIQQFVIIGGGFLLAVFHTNFVFLALLIILKIIADIGGHYFAEVKS
ncbi:MAG: DUF6498-containing protein [Microscillaceae bacterium]|jgi:hypothetical protein|nr:DUF6498-containing protein [Microscillaceae bacterium]